MLKIHHLLLGSYHTNCYIIHEETSKTCAVIDPGYEPERILDYVNQKGLSVESILLTHGHFDHVGGVDAILAATGCALWMKEGDRESRLVYGDTPLFPFAQRDLPISFCNDGDVLHTAGLALTVIATPGHTEGSVCYLCENALFSGDTLFAGTCGRTDLPGSSQQKMLASLRRLAMLEVNYRVFPGHGRPSTLEEEKEYNPYMRG